VGVRGRHWVSTLGTDNIGSAWFNAIFDDFGFTGSMTAERRSFRGRKVTAGSQRNQQTFGMIFMRTG
jgi:hypothetical protein